MSDTISRQAAIDVLEERLRANGYSNVALVSELNRSIGYLMRLPSATLQNLTKPNKSDLIVKGAGEIKDGLYNIKDGKLFQYKANGGTVRTYPIVSADRPTGRWHIEPGIGCFCSKCGFDIANDFDFMEYVRFCPNCGARMESDEQ